jgi:hypothetical protein
MRSRLRGEQALDAFPDGFVHDIGLFRGIHGHPAFRIAFREAAKASFDPAVKGQGFIFESAASVFLTA